MDADAIWELVADNRTSGGRLATSAVVVAVAVVIAVVWRTFAGRVGVVLGLATAGLASAMQEVVGAVAGWFNILSGSIFRVGDRIEMGGVRGDVIDLTPLRPKVMEIGSASDLEDPRAGPAVHRQDRRHLQQGGDADD